MYTLKHKYIEQNSDSYASTIHDMQGAGPWGGEGEVEKTG